MKKKIFLMLSLALMLSCLFVVSVSAEVTVYDDAPAKTIIQVSTNDVVVFDDGFACPSAYIFKDQKLLSLDFSYIKEKTEKDYTIANVVELDIPEGIEEIYQYQFTKNTTMKKCSIPASVTKLNQCIFQQATALEELVMEHTEDSKLDHFPNWMVWGCTSLKAFSMPDCITKMTGVAQFNGCTSLTALYLSENLVSIGSGAGNTASFGFCPNLFFVNEPFTYDNIPTEKPRVYYFPEKLTSFPSGGEVFKNSTSLNDVLVFPEGVTEIANGWAFNGSNAISVVFLGNMVNVSTTGNAWNSEITIYFCNEADKSAADLTGLGGNPKKVYCYAEGNTTHLVEKSMETEATCTEPKMAANYCFCGSIVGTPVTDGEALGHNHSIFVDLVYTSFAEDGYYSYECEVCGDVNNETTANALFKCAGYSSSKTGVNGIAIGFTVNNKAIAEYTEVTGKALKYGVFAAAKEKLGDNDIFGSDGTVASDVISAEITNYSFVAFDLKVIGFTDEYKDTKLALGAYVEVSKGGVTEYSYMQFGTPNEDEKYCFVSYKDIVGEASETEAT